jgi:DNA-binding transcriptional LysR family regulator
LAAVDLKRLRTFVAVAEHGTISAAADVLHITQPALSRQIAGLEQEFGFKLFGRAGSRLMLTASGEQLLGDCRNLLTDVAALSERAQALRRGDTPVFKVTGSALTIEGMFPGFLHLWNERFPATKLAFVEANVGEQLRMLERGEAHLSINILNVIQVDHRRFATHVLPQFHVLAVAAPDHAMPPGDAVEIKDLAVHPLLLPHQSYATRTIFDAACRLAGVQPQILVESGAAHALLALAADRHGVAIIPSILRPDRSVLRALRVTHLHKELTIEVGVLWDRRRAFAHHAEAFAQLMTQHVQDRFVPKRRPAAQPKG